MEVYIWKILFFSFKLTCKEIIARIWLCVIVTFSNISVILQATTTAVLHLIKINENIGVAVMVFNATFNNISSYFVAVSFIGGGNWSTRRKPLTCHKSPTNFIT